MNQEELFKLWDRVRTYFQEVENRMSERLKHTQAFEEYQHFLDHNELGLAFECLSIAVEEPSQFDEAVYLEIQQYLSIAAKEMGIDVEEIE